MYLTNNFQIRVYMLHNLSIDYYKYGSKTCNFKQKYKNI
jgi:hypothetical protein